MAAPRTQAKMRAQNPAMVRRVKKRILAQRAPRVISSRPQRVRVVNPAAAAKKAVAPKAAKKAVAPKRNKPNPLYQPKNVLSGWRLRDAAYQLADTDLNPQIAALKKQGTSTGVQGAALINRADDYYRALAAREQANVAGQNVLAEKLRSQTQQVGGETYAAYNDLMSRVSNAQGVDASIRGPGLEGSSGNTIQQALTDTQRSLGAEQASGERAAIAQGADWTGLTNAAAAATGLRGGELQTQLAHRVLNTQDKINAQTAALEATRGANRSKALTGLRQQQFENQITMEGLGIKQDDLKVQAAGVQQRAADAAASRKSAEKRARISAETSLRRARIAANAARGRANAQIKAQERMLGRKLNADERKSIRSANTSKTNAALAAATSAANNIRTTTAATQRAKQKAETAKKTKVKKSNAENVATIQNVLGLMSATTARKPVIDKAGKPTGATRPAAQNETVQFLRGKKTPEWAIQAGLSIRHHGFILPSVERQMRQAGVPVPPQYSSKSPAALRRAVSNMRPTLRRPAFGTTPLRR